MNGHLSEDLLALYVGDDLNGDAHEQAATHLDSCEECRAALADFELVRQTFRSAYPEPAESELAAARQGLRERLADARRPKRSLWRWSAAAAAAAMLTIVVLIDRHQPLPKPVSVNRQQKATPEKHQNRVAAEAPVVVPEQPKRHVARMKNVRRTAGIREATLITQADRPAQLKLLTVDRNVVVFVQLNERN